MVVNNLDQITTAQSQFGHVACQSNVGIKFKGHYFFLSGTSVMNFVAPDKCSFIQIERIRSVLRFGPVRVARIS
jgi:hypothetical protein